MVQSVQIECNRFYSERDNRTNLIYHQPEDPVRLAVCITDKWASAPVGQLTLLWLCSLVARMGRRYNHLQVCLSQRAANSHCLIPATVAPNLATAVLGHLAEADPCGTYQWVETPTEGSFTLSIGDLSTNVNGQVVCPAGWTAGLFPHGSADSIDPVSDTDFNPVGAALAAALGAAAVYYYFNAGILPGYDVQSPLWISTYDSTTDSSVLPNLGPRLPGSLELGKLLIVGVGALGGNMLAILGSLKHLRGCVNIVDHDVVEMSNLNRLVAAVVRHRQQYKAHIAAESLNGSSVEVLTQVERYERLTATHNVGGLSLEEFDAVISGVDQMASRAFIQSGWPRLLIDGGTGGFTWRVSTFPVASEGACVGCLAGNSQRNFNELRAPMRCAGGQVDQGMLPLQHFESYSFVSFLGAAFLAARLLQRSMGVLPTEESVSTEGDALFLAGMQHRSQKNSERCLCLCGQPISREYRTRKYSKA